MEIKHYLLHFYRHSSVQPEIMPRKSFGFSDDEEETEQKIIKKAKGKNGKKIKNSWNKFDDDKTRKQVRISFFFKHLILFSFFFFVHRLLKCL